MTELIAAASSLPLLQKQRAWSTQMLVKFQPIDTICPSDVSVVKLAYTSDLSSDASA